VHLHFGRLERRVQLRVTVELENDRPGNESEVQPLVYDCAPHVIYCRQNVIMSTLLGAKQIDLGKGGAGIPGSLLKLKRVEMLATKWNSPEAA
jgi:hypothetical protein